MSNVQQLCHPGLAEIPAPDGPQEVISSGRMKFKWENRISGFEMTGPILHKAIVWRGNP